MKLGSLAVLLILGMIFLCVSSAAQLICNNEKPLKETCKKGASNWEAPLGSKIKNVVGKNMTEHENIRNKTAAIATIEVRSARYLSEQEKGNQDPNDENIAGQEDQVSLKKSKSAEQKGDESTIQASDTPSTTWATTKPAPSPRLEFGNTKPTHISDDSHNSFNGFEGDLVGWRKVDIREFPFVVSIMQPKYRVHICTGTLLTSRIVLSYIQCVERRRSVGEKVILTIADPNELIVAAGYDAVKSKEESNLIYREVRIIFTTNNDAFKGKLVFIELDNPVPYSIYHHPVKMYSVDLDIVGRKLQEFVGKSFCEVLTWDDTVICSNGRIKKPRYLKAYRVKILESDECMKQHYRLGLQFSVTAEWSIKGSPETDCFVGMGGRRCGSAPGGPIVCGNAIYGIMTLGTACSEFGDYTFFIPLNNTEIHSLYEQTVATDGKNRISHGRKLREIWLLIIPMLFLCP